MSDEGGLKMRFTLFALIIDDAGPGDALGGGVLIGAARRER